jgi:hypothetical protein
MGEVVDFTARRLAKQQPLKQITWDQVRAEAIDFLLGDWEKMARNNRLNDYFKRSLSSTIDHGSKVNYMSDLNEIATLELNMELYPMIYFPGTISGQQHGWVVKFKLEKETVSTPELASEAYARCFAILLYLKVKRDAISAGLIK